MSDRDAFREARDHGLKARHETREARAVRKAVAEEIALALEEMAAYSRNTIARMNVLCEASAVAREIGSRDPE